MATPLKPKPSPPKRKAASPSKGQKEAPTLPCLCCPVPPKLNRQVIAVLEKVEREEDPTRSRDALATVVVALTHAGLESYFMEPLRLAKAGFLMEQSAALGMAGARQVMGSVISSIIVRMDAPQLRSVCGSIRNFMRGPL